MRRDTNNEIKCGIYFHKDGNGLINLHKKIKTYVDYIFRKSI